MTDRVTGCPICQLDVMTLGSVKALQCKINGIILAVKPQTKQFSPLEVVVVIVVAQAQAGSRLGLKSLGLSYHVMCRSPETVPV